MTGLEDVLKDDRVQRYLAAKQLRAQTLMPGWKGWDTPHLMRYPTGGIIPTSPELLLEDAIKWTRAKPETDLKCPRCGEWNDVFDPYENPPDGPFSVRVIACWHCGRESHAKLWKNRKGEAFCE